MRRYFTSWIDRQWINMFILIQVSGVWVDNLNYKICNQWTSIASQLIAAMALVQWWCTPHSPSVLLLSHSSPNRLCFAHWADVLSHAISQYNNLPVSHSSGIKSSNSKWGGGDFSHAWRQIYCQQCYTSTYVKQDVRILHTTISGIAAAASHTPEMKLDMSLQAMICCILRHIRWQRR